MIGKITSTVWVYFYNLYVHILYYYYVYSYARNGKLFWHHWVPSPPHPPIKGSCYHRQKLLHSAHTSWSYLLVATRALSVRPFARILRFAPLHSVYRHPRLSRLVIASSNHADTVWQWTLSRDLFSSGIRMFSVRATHRPNALNAPTQ